MGGSVRLVCPNRVSVNRFSNFGIGFLQVKDE